MELLLSDGLGGGKNAACLLCAYYAGVIKEPPPHSNINEADMLITAVMSNIFTFFKKPPTKQVLPIKISFLSDKMAKIISSKQLPLLLTSEGELKDNTKDIINYLIMHSNMKEPLLNDGADRWISFAEQHNFCISSSAALNELDEHLESRTFLQASHITAADIAVYTSIYSTMQNTMEKILKGEAVQRGGLVNVRRWFDHIQHLHGIRAFAELFLPPIDVTQEGSKGKKNVEANGIQENEEKSTGKGQKNGETKKEKKGKEQKKSEKEEDKKGGGANDRPVDDVTRLDVRVGVIKKVWRHPDAERLFCEEIDIGEDKVRMIASGLVGYLTEENLLNQKVLVLANMKPKSLRGFASHGMVLCATNADKSKLELMKPPPDVAIGERVTWEGMEGEADAVMNTKTGKDPFVAVQPSFKTGEDKIGYFKDKKFMTSKGPCFCDSLVGASIS